MREVVTLKTGGDSNLSYLLVSKEREGVIIDPSYKDKPILDAIEEKTVKITAILLTHSHHDHCATLDHLKTVTKADVWVSEEEDCAIEKTLPDSMLGKLGISAYKTPGHTKGSCCFEASGFLFTGDTLFIDYVGRTDLYGGSTEDLFNSLKSINNLNHELILKPGHDYGSVISRSLKEETDANPFLNAKSIGELQILINKMME